MSTSVAAGAAEATVDVSLLAAAVVVVEFEVYSVVLFEEVVLFVVSSCISKSSVCLWISCTFMRLNISTCADSFWFTLFLNFK
jgi:hypothetical protein